NGAVYELLPNGTIVIRGAFDGANGFAPEGGVLVDRDGNLFGTTSQGGPTGAGTVFEIPAGTNTIVTLTDFSGTNIDDPFSRMAMDSHGNLFGTTESGGTSNLGAIF